MTHSTSWMYTLVGWVLAALVVVWLIRRLVGDWSAIFRAVFLAGRRPPTPPHPRTYITPPPPPPPPGGEPPSFT